MCLFSARHNKFVFLLGSLVLTAMSVFLKVFRLVFMLSCTDMFYWAKCHFNRSVMRHCCMPQLSSSRRKRDLGHVFPWITFWQQSAWAVAKAFLNKGYVPSSYPLVLCSVQSVLPHCVLQERLVKRLLKPFGKPSVFNQLGPHYTAASCAVHKHGSYWPSLPAPSCANRSRVTPVVRVQALPRGSGSQRAASRAPPIGKGSDVPSI